MVSYIVSWKIDIDADNPVQAAEYAQLMIQPDPVEWIFEVTDPDGEVTEVDLEYEHARDEDDIE
jgi:hypothetical protein